jgi:hypothetical protein
MLMNLTLTKEELDQAIYCYLRARRVITANTELEILVQQGNSAMPIRISYTLPGRVPSAERLVEEQKTAWDRLKDEE